MGVVPSGAMISPVSILFILGNFDFSWLTMALADAGLFLDVVWFCLSWFHLAHARGVGVSSPAPRHGFNRHVGARKWRLRVPKCTTTQRETFCPHRLTFSALFSAHRFDPKVLQKDRLLQALSHANKKIFCLHDVDN